VLKEAKITVYQDVLDKFVLWNPFLLFFS
jgi:hypothetical protein